MTEKSKSKENHMLIDYYADEFDDVRSLVTAIVESVSDITFGNPKIAEYIEKGLLCVSDGKVRIAPSIQEEDAFCWWISALITVTSNSTPATDDMSLVERKSAFGSLGQHFPAFSPIRCRYCKMFFARLKRDSQMCKPCIKKLGSLKNSDVEKKLPAVPAYPKWYNEFGSCPGAKCPIRTRLEDEKKNMMENLRHCWRYVRSNIRALLYRKAEMANPRGDASEIDVEQLTAKTNLLIDQDPHQLYKRLESMGHNFVMEMKVALFQILVSPEKHPMLKKFYETNTQKEICDILQGKLFIRELLDKFAKFQDAVRAVAQVLTKLDSEYLKRFGIGWSVISNHIFYTVIYYDDLFKTNIAKIEGAFRLKLMVDDNKSLNDMTTDKEYLKNIPAEVYQGVQELAQSFRVFHRLMITSREIFLKANSHVKDYVIKQRLLNARTKGRLVEKDFDFFKCQRKLMRDISDSTQNGVLNQWLNKHASCIGATENVLDSDEERDIGEAIKEDDMIFAKRFGELVEKRSISAETLTTCEGSRKAISKIQCKFCEQSFCSCDECSLLHLIVCGLFDYSVDVTEMFKGRDYELELPDSDDDDQPSQGDADDADDIDSISLARSSPPLSPHEAIQLGVDMLAATSLFTVHNTIESSQRLTDVFGDWEVYDYEYMLPCPCETEDLDFLHQPEEKPEEKKKKVEPIKKEITIIKSDGKEQRKRKKNRSPLEGICITQRFSSKKYAARREITISAKRGSDSGSIELPPRISADLMSEIEKTLESRRKERADDSNSSCPSEASLEFVGPDCQKLMSQVMRSKKGELNHNECTNPDNENNMNVPWHKNSTDSDRTPCECCFCIWQRGGEPYFGRQDSRKTETVERLRKLLKKRGEEKSTGDSDVRIRSNSSECPDFTQKTEQEIPVDELLKFIEENDKPNQENDQESTAKAAKRARQKQKKLEEKRKKEEERLRLEEEKAAKAAKLREEKQKKMEEEARAKESREAQRQADLEEKRKKREKRKKKGLSMLENADEDNAEEKPSDAKKDTGMEANSTRMSPTKEAPVTQNQKKKNSVNKSNENSIPSNIKTERVNAKKEALSNDKEAIPEQKITPTKKKNEKNSEKKPQKAVIEEKDEKKDFIDKTEVKTSKVLNKTEQKSANPASNQQGTGKASSETSKNQEAPQKITKDPKVHKKEDKPNDENKAPKLANQNKAQQPVVQKQVQVPNGTSIPHHDKQNKKVEKDQPKSENWKKISPLEKQETHTHPETHVHPPRATSVQPTPTSPMVLNTPPHSNQSAETVPLPIQKQIHPMNSFDNNSRPESSVSTISSSASPMDTAYFSPLPWSTFVSKAQEINQPVAAPGFMPYNGNPLLGYAKETLPFQNAIGTRPSVPLGANPNEVLHQAQRDASLNQMYGPLAGPNMRALSSTTYPMENMINQPKQYVNQATNGVSNSSHATNIFGAIGSPSPMNNAWNGSFVNGQSSYKRPHSVTTSYDPLRATSENVFAAKIDSGSDLFPGNKKEPSVEPISCQKSKFGAIGEKPPKKTFNQYAAYDRETNDLFSSMRDQSRNIANLSPMSNPINPAFAVPTPPNNSNILDKISPASIWRDDDNLRRFVESEECTVYKFSDF
uniref:Uncharacterized protein n=1 Tax=Acrobeloides nanus TaxID=290746 RepID=A0A914E6V1_9BILA